MRGARTDLDGWVLEVGQWASTSPLSQRLLRDGAPACRLQVRVIPRQAKLPDSLWCTLLDELEAALPGVAVGLSAGRSGAVGSDGVAAPWLVEALAPLIPSLMQRRSSWKIRGVLPERCSLKFHFTECGVPIARCSAG
jgi:hypothetical protein